MPYLYNFNNVLKPKHTLSLTNVTNENEHLLFAEVKITYYMI